VYCLIGLLNIKTCKFCDSVFETQFVTLRVYELMVFENMVLVKTFIYKNEKVTGGLRKFHIVELLNLKLG